jgi:hypothetical protein
LLPFSSWSSWSSFPSKSPSSASLLLRPTASRGWLQPWQQLLLRDDLPLLLLAALHFLNSSQLRTPAAAA